MLVYILYSNTLNKYYVGSTNNIERRLIEHNSGHSKFTSTGKPWQLVMTIKCEDRTNALKLEKQIKKRGIKRYLTDKRSNG